MKITITTSYPHDLEQLDTVEISGRRYRVVDVNSRCSFEAELVPPTFRERLSKLWRTFCRFFWAIF